MEMEFQQSNNSFKSWSKQACSDLINNLKDTVQTDKIDKDLYISFLCLSLYYESGVSLKLWSTASSMPPKAAP